MATGRLRIGELSKRVGVSPELLRAWETRYGLVTPERSAGGLRLYSEADETRVRAMCEHLRAGMSASEAARLAGAGAPGGATAPIGEIEQALSRSLTALDEPGAQRALDALFGAVDVETAVAQVVLPLLRQLGDGWEAGEVSVAEEHFASHVVGGRVRALARGWGDGVGPTALLACPPGEQHDLGLACFGLLLRARGWRIAYLGASTPPAEVGVAIEKAGPTVVVLAAVASKRFRAAADEIRGHVAGTRLAIGGAGASRAVAELLGAELLPADAAEAANALTP